MNCVKYESINEPQPYNPLITAWESTLSFTHIYTNIFWTISNAALPSVFLPFYRRICEADGFQINVRFRFYMQIAGDKQYRILRTVHSSSKATKEI